MKTCPKFPRGFYSYQAFALFTLHQEMCITVRGNVERRTHEVVKQSHIVVASRCFTAMRLPVYKLSWNLIPCLTINPTVVNWIVFCLGGGGGVFVVVVCVLLSHHLCRRPRHWVASSWNFTSHQSHRPQDKSTK